MLKKSIAVAFLSIFVASPALAIQRCTIDFPPDDRENGRMWQIWVKSTYNYSCGKEYMSISTPGPDGITGSRLVNVSSMKTFTTGWRTDYRLRFRYPSQYWSTSIELETIQADGFFRENCENPLLENGPRIADTGTFQRYVIVKRRHYDNRITRSELGFARGSDIEIRPYRPSPGDDLTPIKVNCPPPPDDDDDECPDLNLTIRGTLLPARRGTARISGDWCKSLGCGRGILK